MQSDPYLVVEVEEALRAIDIVKRSKARNWSINVHWVGPEFSPRCKEHPMWGNTTDQDTVVSGNISKVPKLAYDWVIAHHTRICVFICLCCMFFLGSLIKSMFISQG